MREEPQDFRRVLSSMCTEPHPVAREAAERFLAGEDQERPWEGDWGYLIVTHDIAGGPEPIGVGLYTYGSLQSMLPKGRRREF